MVVNTPEPAGNVQEVSNDTEIKSIDLTWAVKLIFLLIGLYPFNFIELLKQVELFHVVLDLIVIAIATIAYFLFAYLLFFAVGKNGYKKIENYLSFSQGPESFLSVLSTVLIAPVTEELVFRLKLLVWLDHRLPLILAIVISSLAFTLMHINYFKIPAVFLFVFAEGVLLGISFVITGNILIPIIIHLIHNSFSTFIPIYLKKRRANEHT